MPTTAYKPDGHQSVSPYLIVTDAEATIRFLKDVFGAKEILRHTSSEGSRIMHAEVRLDDSVIMIADQVKDAWPATPSHLHVYVPDVDATYALALSHWATPLKDPVQEGDEDKRGGFRDPWGTSWWIGTRQETVQRA